MEIKTYSIIYNAIDEVKDAMEGMLERKMVEKIVANVEVRNVFKFERPPSPVVTSSMERSFGTRRSGWSARHRDLSHG